MSSSSINENQMVFGDMTTLYISQRLTEGVSLYQDIPVTYGPIMYLVGQNLISLGLTYSGLKIFMLGIAVFSGILVYLITKNSFKDSRVAILSTSVYMFLPIHYGMAPVFHADSFAVFFILISLYFLLKNNSIGFFVAGIFAAIAFFTKIPVIPLVLAPFIYFLYYKKKQGLYYIIPLLSIIIPVMLYVNLISKNSDNIGVFIDMVLKDPNPPFVYVWNLGWIEGFSFLVAIFGILLYLKNVKPKSVLPFMALSSIVTFSAVLIPGVGVYEANYMEPFVAIFVGFAIFHLKENWKFKIIKERKNIVPIFLIVLIFAQIIIFDLPDRERIADWDGNGRAKVLNEIADSHTRLLEKYSSEGDVVIASPMAVYRADRILPMDNPFRDGIILKQKYGYDSATEEISILENMIKNKEIKILITFNSTSRNESKYNIIQEKEFFPFYMKSFSELLNQKYERFEEDGFNYFLPRS